MKTKMGFFLDILVLMVSLVFLLVGSAYSEKMNKPGSAAMKMHHLHMILNHGSAMALQGANLVMIAKMEMTPAVDATTLHHGQQMIKMGKEVIQHALSGPEMTALMKTHGDAPLMKYTHKLGKALLKVIDHIGKRRMEGMKSPDTMTMHHMHIMVTHALEMAVGGSNMIMLGKMSMAGTVDDFSIKRGGMMIANGRGLVAKIMEGKTMKGMHARGVKPDSNRMMDHTMKLNEAAMKVMDLLSEMPK